MNKQKKFMKLLRRKFIIIITLMGLVIFTIFSALLLINNYNGTQLSLLNKIGNQRMLTQSISKNVSRKYVIMQSIYHGSLVESKQTLNQKLININQYLRTSQIEFQNQLDLLTQDVKSKTPFDRRFFQQDTYNTAMKLTDDIHSYWNDFNESLNVMIYSDTINVESTKALIYINTNNDSLMEHIDNLSRLLLNYEKTTSFYSTMLIILLFIISLIALFISVYQMRKYIILPLYELYEGVSKMKLGIFDFKIRSHEKGELSLIISDIEESFEKLSIMNSLIRNINQNTSFKEILEFIFNSFSPFIPYSHIGIALIGDHGNSIEGNYTISKESLNNIPTALTGLKVNISDTSLGKIIETGQPRIINDLAEYVEGMPEKQYNKILLNAGIKSSITFPLKIHNNPIGLIFFSSLKEYAYTEEYILFLQTLSESIAISLNINIFIDELIYSSILALAKMADTRDDETGDHLERMKIYSQKITEFLIADQKYLPILTIDFIKDLARFSPMHDIGKVGIRDGILLKPGKLTQEEFAEMKKHTIYGANVLQTAEENINKHGKSLFKMGIEIALSHHEKWSGTGYPYGIKGQDIPLSARIIAVADVLDALTSKRVYKDAFSFEDAIKMMIEESGKHFDPSIIESLIKHKEELYKIYKDCQK